MELNNQKKPVKNVDATSIASSDDPDAEFQTIIRYGNKTEVFRALMHEFLKDSSIQGFKYFCERRRHWTERIFWMIIFVIATYWSGFLIQATWEKWNESPVIVSFSDKSTPIWEIPFPAVTICPETKAVTGKLNFSDTYAMMMDHSHQANISEEIMERLETMTQLCIPPVVKMFNFTTNFTDSHIYEILQDIAPSFTSTLSACEWLYNSKSCKKSFEPIITEEGICYTFNALNSHEVYTEEIAPEMMTVNSSKSKIQWNLEDGYTNADASNDFFEIYPRLVLDSGVGSGLSFILILDKRNFDYVCCGPSQGFKVVLHTPGEIPQVSKHFFRLPAKGDVTMSVKPNMITTSKNLRHYDANKRQCFFNSERKLRFFKVYTQRNCDLECLSNFTKIECGCVKFSSPRDEDTPICGMGKWSCYMEARKKFVLNIFDKSKGNAAHGTCNCLPSCTSITYDAEMSQSEMNIEQLLQFLGANESTANRYQISRLSISFKEQQFQTSKRSELFGVTDFIANCGGILGLFIGITALSFVEIFYYCTLRLYWTLRICRFSKRNTETKTNSKSLVNPVDETIAGYNNAGLKIDTEELNDYSYS